MKSTFDNSIETNFEIRSLDTALSRSEYQALKRNPIIFVLDNLRSAFNVGSIFRMADILRVEEVVLCGYTPYPPHAKLEKTSMGTVNYVKWTHFPTTLVAVDHIKKQNTAIWAVETTSASKPFHTVAYPPRIALVFGNEALGVNAEVIAACDDIIEIPTFGYKNSMNVAAACAVVGYKAVEMINGLVREAL